MNSVRRLLDAPVNKKVKKKKELKNEERSCGKSFLSLHFGHEDKVLQN